MMSQSVQESRREGGVAQDLGPTRELQVAGDEETPPFIAMSTELEK